MSVWRSMYFAFICFVALPAVVHAGVSDPFIYSQRFINVPMIAAAPYGTPQTAFRAGDSPTLQVFVHSRSDAPYVLSDFSLLGLAQSTTTVGQWVGYGALHYPSYFYNFGPLPIGVAISDGRYDLPVTATNTTGSTTVATTSIVIDTTPPALSLSDISFSTLSPKKGDIMYLSGVGSGTGSALTVRTVREILFDEAGNLVWRSGSGINYAVGPALSSAIASSSDGSFVRFPIVLTDGDPNGLAQAAKIQMSLSGYDEAGNTVTTSLTVPIPRPPPPDPCVAANSCVSNVLFLPGIEGSRLYEGTACGKSAEEKLWEPFESVLKAVRGAGDVKVRDLFLDQTGASACADIYTKEGEVIDAIEGSNIYASLMNEMNDLKADDTIKDWKPVAYDWRLSLDDLLTKGAERDGRIYYDEATSTPYIEQTLRALATTSKTGKVTIIAHSNGGLVAKALLNKLGDTVATELVDKILMVGVPQTGAPADLGATLVGYDAGIYADISKLKGALKIVSNVAARALIQNSPMAYHLLPSEEYLESTMGDSMHPVIRFSGAGYLKEKKAYGNTIANRVALDDFLLAKEGGRVKPKENDLQSAEILNPALIDYANSMHATLDAWVPPSGIEIFQIAGWGVDTVAGIDFYTPPAISVASALEPMRLYRPIFIEDGDGTVPVPSALMMATSTNVKRYWVNLGFYYKNTKIRRTHPDLFEIPSLQDFVRNVIKNSTSTLPAYISSIQPPSATENKKLTFFLHSPLTLQLTDSSGNSTGIAPDGSVEQGIPDSVYGEFGEVKYVTVPQGGRYQLSMQGQANGTFSLDMQESSGGVVTAESTIANVPTTASTLVSLSIGDGIDTASPLIVDENGDGGSIITITARAGETVSYEPLSSPAPIIYSYAGGGISLPVVPAVVATVEMAEKDVVVTIAPPTSSEVAVKVAAITTTRMQKVATIHKKNIQDVPQLAAVYPASQQPALRRLSTAVYNKIHGLWAVLRKLF